MIRRTYDEDEVGYVEYDDENEDNHRVKKFYGQPRFYHLPIYKEETKEVVNERFENVIYSWNNF